MDISIIISSQWYEYLILPLLIFLARVADVSLGTIRVIFITREMKFLSFIVGFFEIVIWLAVINQIFINISNIVAFFAYALGFATGNYIGILIEKRISLGKVIMRIIANKEANSIIKDMQNITYSITNSHAESPEGRVRIINAITNRHNINKIINIVRQYNPHAFYSIEDVRYAFEEHPVHMPKKRVFNFRMGKKGK